MPQAFVTMPLANDLNNVAAGAIGYVYGPVMASGGMYLYGLITSTQTFDLYLEISVDNFVTSTIAKKISSTANPDGTYTQAVELSQYTPNFFRISAKNTSATTANYRADVRLFATAAK